MALSPQRHKVHEVRSLRLCGDGYKTVRLKGMFINLPDCRYTGNMTETN